MSRFGTLPIEPAGALRHRVVIQTASETADAHGEPVKTWNDTATVWASVNPMGGRERFQSQQIESEVDTTIRMRKRALNEKQRIKWTDADSATRIYNIKYILNPQELGGVIVAYCTEDRTADS
jgi:SPP1 family predicted phage head-tail adaptor